MQMRTSVNVKVGLVVDRYQGACSTVGRFAQLRQGPILRWVSLWLVGDLGFSLLVSVRVGDDDVDDDDDDDDVGSVVIT